LRKCLQATGPVSAHVSAYVAVTVTETSKSQCVNLYQSLRRRGAHSAKRLLSMSCDAAGCINRALKVTKSHCPPGIRDAITPYAMPGADGTNTLDRPACDAI